ncbi:MAG TPA: translation elongation factor Ts [Stellaceae bacterium]|nr:translation elongation factor Ts [Stellaceae bacterium]
MAEITASLVKDLRERTNAGMMDCKRALSETSGDVEQAVDWLRKKGLAAAAKKAGRVAAEGLVGVATSGRTGALVEVNSETDFVARNDAFQVFVRAATELALEKGDDIETLRAEPYPGTGRNLGEELAHLIATIGENMTFRRARRLEVKHGAVVSYVHSAVAPGIGKIGVLIALESGAESDGVSALGRQLAMHVAAANPLYLDIASVDKETLEREREILRDQARQSGKPEAIIEKMVEGRLRKFYEESVLLEQVYVIDGETRVGKVVEAAAKQLGSPVRVVGYARFKVGEGIEKKESDFAAEVAAQLKS